jgi:hypothetical protein
MKYYYDNLDGMAETEAQMGPGYEAAIAQSKPPGIAVGNEGVAIGQSVALISPLIKDLFKRKKKKPKAPKFNSAMYQRQSSSTSTYLIYGALVVALAGAGILVYRKFKKRKT